jgi:competence protein ComEA
VTVPWPRAAQRVLIVLAAGLLALAVVLGKQAARQPVAVVVPDDSAIEVRLDLNSATPADLETLPGVGISLAGRIDAYRKTHGPFRSVDELGQVPGFGEKLVTTLRPLVTVNGNQ